MKKRNYFKIKIKPACLTEEEQKRLLFEVFDLIFSQSGRRTQNKRKSKNKRNDSAI